MIILLVVVELLPPPFGDKKTSWTCDSVVSLTHVGLVLTSPSDRLRERDQTSCVYSLIPGGPCAFPAACAQDSILRECICA